MRPDGELYIRYSATDNGGPIPSGTPYYLSPAIEIVGGVDAGTARAGVAQLIRVWVGNLGSNTRTDVTVQVFATDWGTINPWLQSLGGTSGAPGGPFTVVGNAAWQTNTEGVIDIGWQPSPAELGGNMQKHVCLFANVHRSGDGAPMTPTPSFDVIGNQHHAQRNIKLVAMSFMKRLRFGLWAANMFEERREFLLEVAGLREARLDPIERRHLRSAAWLARAQDKLGKPLPGRTPGRAPILVTREGKGEKLEVSLEPGEQIPLILEAGQAGDEPGLQRFEIVQRDARTGDVVGGGRLIAAVVPEELIPDELTTDPDLPEK